MNTITVEFTVSDRVKFEKWLQEATGGNAASNDAHVVIGYRAGDKVDRRTALELFANAMEQKLRKNDHKRGWHEKPLAALKALFELEMSEFQVAYEHFVVAEARPELVDVANFALILWDRLGALDQEQNVPKEK